MSSTNGIDLSLFDPAALMASVTGSDEGASFLDENEDGSNNNNNNNNDEEAMHERIWADLMQEGSNTPEPDPAQAPVKQEDEALPVGLPADLQLEFDASLVGASGVSDREESPPMDLDSFLDASIAAAKDHSPVAGVASASPSQSVSAALPSPEPQSQPQPAQQAAPVQSSKAASPAPPVAVKPDVKPDIKQDTKQQVKPDAKPDVKPKASNKRKADQAVSQPAPPAPKSKAPKPPTPKPTPVLRTSKSAAKPSTSASQAKAATSTTNVSTTPVPAATPIPAPAPTPALAPQSAAPTVDPRLTKAALQAAHIMTLVQRMLDAASTSHTQETPESLIQHVVRLARMDTDQLLALQVIFSQITKAHESRAAIAAAQAQAQANQVKPEKSTHSSPPS